MIKAGWLTDHLPAWLRYVLTDSYWTRAETAEFEANHDAGFVGFVDRIAILPPQKWTAHGWCEKCDALAAALPPFEEYTFVRYGKREKDII